MGRVRLVLVVFCSIVLLGTAFLWWRSRTHSDVLAVSTPAGTLQAIASHRGGFVAFASDVPFQADGGGYVDGVDCPAEDLDDINDTVFDKTAVTRSALGFMLATSTLAVGGTSRDYYAIRVPHWAIVATSSFMFVTLARAPLRRRRWRKQGRCSGCGYDLRESPERCPECGMATTVADAARERQRGRWRASPWRKQLLATTLIVAALSGGWLVLRGLLPTPGTGWSQHDSIVHVYPARDLAAPADWPPGGLLAYKASLPQMGNQIVAPDDWRREQLDSLAAAVQDLSSAGAAPQGVVEANAWTTDHLLVTAPSEVQRDYAALITALRSPVGAALTTIIAGESAPTTQAAQDAQQKLDTVMPDVHFDRVGLEVAINQIRDATHANLIVDWRGLEAAGIDRNAPVELRVCNLSAAKVLAEVLTYVGGDTVKLAFRVDDGIVRVTTADELAKSTDLRIYDVRTLLRNVVASRRRLAEQLGSPLVKPQPQPSSSPGAAAGGPTGPLEDPYADAAEELVNILQETIEPDVWRANGGNVGSIREWAGRLIIQQTPEGHRAVEGLLKQLNDAYREEGATEPSSRPVTEKR
jgi:hypothetical protein